MTRTAIIIGASSGIGAALARQLASRGCGLGLAARRLDRLEELSRSLPTTPVLCRMAVGQADEARRQFESLVEELGEIDLVIIAAGTGHENPSLEWHLERDTIDTNVTGFTAIADVAVHVLERQQRGTLVGISSIAAIRGHGDAPAYGASKAYVSHYLAALRHRFARRRCPVQVLDVQPGFVDTAMAKGPGLFWVAPVDKAARQIIRAIDRRRTHVYVTRRWRLIAWLLRLLPQTVYNRL